MTIEEIRGESELRNSNGLAQGHAWGVVIPTLLAEIDRLTVELEKFFAESKR